MSSYTIYIFSLYPPKYNSSLHFHQYFLLLPFSTHYTISKPMFSSIQFYSLPTQHYETNIIVLVTSRNVFRFILILSPLILIYTMQYLTLHVFLNYLTFYIQSQIYPKWNIPICLRTLYYTHLYVYTSTHPFSFPEFSLCTFLRICLPTHLYTQL